MRKYPINLSQSHYHRLIDRHNSNLPLQPNFGRTSEQSFQICALLCVGSIDRDDLARGICHPSHRTEWRKPLELSEFPTYSPSNSDVQPDAKCHHYRVSDADVYSDVNCNSNKHPNQYPNKHPNQYPNQYSACGSNPIAHKYFGSCRGYRNEHACDTLCHDAGLCRHGCNPPANGNPATNWFPYNFGYRGLATCSGTARRSVSASF